MTHRRILTFVLPSALFVALFGFALMGTLVHAEDGGDLNEQQVEAPQHETGAQQQIQERARETQKAEAERQHEAVENASSSDDEDVNDEDVDDDGGHYHNQVSDIVHKLREAADQDEGIGDEVRAVAEEEASSTEQATEAMRDLDNEGAIKKFFLGPDFGSLGELRSTLVATENHIDRLTKAQERVTDPAAKTTLESQIAALQDVASSTREFIDAHENTFSLFGWLVRFFSQ